MRLKGEKSGESYFNHCHHTYNFVCTRLLWPEKAVEEYFDCTYGAGKIYCASNNRRRSGKKYMAAGSYEIGYFEADYAENADIKKIEIWYPEELETSSEQYPVVVFVNGTGVAASRYKPVFEHLASWGFIAIGNEDPSTWEGKKADATLSWLLAANEDETSIFYHRVDTNNIGITGHSQGGVGVFHAINETEHKELYKCAVSLSPTQEDMAEALKMPYDSSKTAIPVMILAGAPNDVISLEGLNDRVKKISAGVVVARRSNTDHGQMLYSGDGYVTAWFM